MLSPFAKARLERENLQSRLSFNSLPPRLGWIRAVRSALGMRTAQLARRLGVRPQAIAEFERSERERRITLQSLDRIADAMDCTVVYYFVPKQRTFDAVFDRQAKAFLEHTQSGVAHTMELEGQGAKARSSVRNSIEDAWTLVTSHRHLWDVGIQDTASKTPRKTKRRKKSI